MFRKIAFGVLLTLLLFVFVYPVIAQEPTAEPSVSDESGVTVVQPEDGGVVIVQPDTPAAVEDTGFNLDNAIPTILSVAAVVATLFTYLDVRQVKQIRDAGEKVEGFGWTAAATLSDIMRILGGQPDVETSSDPAVIARALRDRNTHVFIRKDVDLAAVLREYQRLSI